MPAVSGCYSSFILQETEYFLFGIAAWVSSHRDKLDPLRLLVRAIKLIIVSLRLVHDQHNAVLHLCEVVRTLAKARWVDLKFGLTNMGLVGRGVPHA